MFRVIWNMLKNDLKQPEEEVKTTHQDPDPDDLSIDNAYKTRWVWYHTILAIELFLVNVILIAILVVLAIKL